MNFFSPSKNNGQEKLTIPPHNRLSKEELLNGKHAPTEDEKKPAIVVKGIYNPDEILKRHAQSNGIKIDLKKIDAAEKKSQEMAEREAHQNNGSNPASFDEVTNPNLLQGSHQFSPHVYDPDPFSQPTSMDDQDLAYQVEELKTNHAIEINRWRRYEAKVNEWKESVLSVVRDLQTSLEKSEERAFILEELKRKIAERDQEIIELRKQLKQK